MALKLLVEQPTFELEYLQEDRKDASGQKTLFINGPFLMAEKKNKNGRVYKLDEMVKEVSRYTTEMVKTNRSLGELNHPTSVEINPERACHMVTEMRQDGNLFYGKSKILNTPVGNIVRSLIQDGVKLGVSSRALGKLTENGDHNDVSEFKFICVDVVHDPSVETAFVNGILESKEWILKCDGSVCEWVQAAHDKLQESCSCLPKHDKEAYLKEQIMGFLKEITKKT